MIPVADERDDSAYRPDKEWRKYFSKQLSGSGIELGALHRPMVVPPELKVTYVDQFPIEVLREHYPELAKHKFVVPDILDDAGTLKTIESDSQDFVIAAHVIEHMCNPIRALDHWVRVLKSGGKLYLVVPDKRAIFDSKRVRTTLAHMVYDFMNPSKDRDYLHFLEYSEMVDNDIHFHGRMTPSEIIQHANHLQAMKYSIHFHCFLPKDMLALLNWFGAFISNAEIKILEGPVMGRKDSEFHVLLEKI